MMSGWSTLRMPIKGIEITVLKGDEMKDKELRQKVDKLEDKVESHIGNQVTLDFHYCPACKKETLQMRTQTEGCKSKRVSCYEWTYERTEEQWRCAACGSHITHKETTRTNHKIVKGDC